MHPTTARMTRKTIILLLEQYLPARFRIVGGFTFFTTGLLGSGGATGSALSRSGSRRRRSCFWSNPPTSGLNLGMVVASGLFSRVLDRVGSIVRLKSVSSLWRRTEFSRWSACCIANVCSARSLMEGGAPCSLIGRGMFIIVPRFFRGEGKKHKKHHETHGLAERTRFSDRTQSRA